MKKLRFFAALCCAAAVFAACEKNDEPKSGNQNNNNSPIENPDTQYTLTVLSNDETLGTVTGSGKYDVGATVKIVATPADGAELISWSDTSSVELEREITLTSDSTITATFRITTGTENGHDWVSLGLPSGTKWATCNVGATSPEKYGNYYAWGETEPKETYSWNTYKYGDGTTFSKYNTTDGKTTLEASDDAATTNWGSAWRMPTDGEWTELREQCEWKWTDSYQTTGVAGYWVTGKNGNTIFLPAAGFRYSDNLSNVGSYGGYRSSSLVTDYPIYAWYASFYSDYVGRAPDDSRCCGYSVRPVLPLNF